MNPFSLSEHVEYIISRGKLYLLFAKVPLDATDELNLHTEMIHGSHSRELLRYCRSAGYL